MNDKITATDIIQAAYRRWGSDSHLCVEEAPEDRSRQGRKIDLLVLGLWQSNGFEIDAVEVKVSAADLRKEIANPHKTAFWWAHSNRFWIATTPNVWKLCKEEIPDTWGVLVLQGESLVKKRQAPKTVAEEISHLTWLGVGRAIRAGADGLVRAASNEAYKRGKEAANGTHRESWILEEYNALLAEVREFEKASGVSIRHGWDLAHVGDLVKCIRRKGPLAMAEMEAAKATRYSEALAAIVTELSNREYATKQSTAR